MRQERVSEEPAGPDQDIVVSKWIGLEGTALLARQYGEKLRERFPRRMIDEAAAFDRYLSVASEAATAMKSVGDGAGGRRRTGSGFEENTCQTGNNRDL